MTKEEAKKQSEELAKEINDAIDAVYAKLNYKPVGLDGPVPKEVKEIKAKGMEKMKKIWEQVKE